MPPQGRIHHIDRALCSANVPIGLFSIVVEQAVAASRLEVGTSGPIICPVPSQLNRHAKLLLTCRYEMNGGGKIKFVATHCIVSRPTPYMAAVRGEHVLQ